MLALWAPKADGSVASSKAAPRAWSGCDLCCLCVWSCAGFWREGLESYFVLHPVVRGFSPVCLPVQPNAVMQFVGAESGDGLHPKSPGSGELESEHS